jgi:hypothetical protein
MGQRYNLSRETIRCILNQAKYDAAAGLVGCPQQRDARKSRKNEPDKPSRLAFRSLKQHLVIGSTCQRAIEGRVPNPCFRFSKQS